MPGYVLVDGSNIGFAATCTAKLHVGGQETQGVYGFVRMLRPIAAKYPDLRVVVLWDGHSWRYKDFPEYKASRNADPKTKYDEELRANRDSFRIQKSLIHKALEILGVCQMFAANLEADDLAAMITKRAVARGEKVVLVSGDKDWVQLLNENVSWIDPINPAHLTIDTLPKKLGYRPSHEKWDAKANEMKKAPARFGITDGGDTFPGWVGVPTPRAWLDMKALMGDISDDIPGVGGIGEKGALELVVEYGSVHGFINRTIDSSMPKIHKKFQDFADSPDKQELYNRNLRLMDLNSPSVPTPINFSATNHVLDAKAWEQFCHELLFKSLLTDMDGWLAPFRR